MMEIRGRKFVLGGRVGLEALQRQATVREEEEEDTSMNSP